MLVALLPLLARAESGLAEVVLHPEVALGELEIDSHASVARHRDGHSSWAGRLGIEYGFTAWWASEATLGFGREHDGSTEPLSLEWENRFQLLGGEARDVVLGALLAVERELDRGGDGELRYGPLLQYARGPLQVNLNLLFERRLRAGGDLEPTEIGYQWQWRWRRDAPLDWGLQGFGALGRWNDWASSARQSHVLGPVLFAGLGEPAVARGNDDEDAGDAGDGPSPQLEAGLLLGTGGEAPRLTLRLQATVPF